MARDLQGMLTCLAGVGLPSSNGFTYLNPDARALIVQCATLLASQEAEIAELRVALTELRDAARSSQLRPAETLRASEV